MYLLARVSFIALFSLILLGASAQEFGGNPPSLKWKQINNDTVRIIFPDGLQEVAKKIAAITGQMGTSQYTIGNRFRKINIVLQNQTTISNAYVGLGPRRSEFFMTPQQNSFELGSLPWYQQLAQHEWRHVQQFNNFNKGISRLFYILAGEYGLSFINSTAIPNWFWEGDAVYSETHLSTQGRGRIPYFFNGYRSVWASEKNYSWLKLRNGSLRDYVPDHYQLGYLLTAYGRQKYGKDVWAKVTNDAVRFKGLFYPFQSAVKRNIGISYKEYRKAALEYFNVLEGTTKTASSNWAKQQKHFAGSEEYPQWIDSSHLLFVKSSYKSIPKFIKRNIITGEEDEIRVKDISLDNHFSFSNGKIVYAAVGFDLRWGWRDYSDIRIIDITNGNQRTVVRKSKYFAPDIAADGKSIVAVKVETDGSCRLDILDTDSGAIVKSLANKAGYYFTYPKFYGPRKIVSPVRNQTGEMALGIFSIENDDVEWLLPFSGNIIGFTNVKGDTITFSASSGETDKNFAIINRKLYEVNNLSKGIATGSYQLSIGEGGIVWTDFTAVGYHLMHEKLSENTFQPALSSQIRTALPIYGITTINDSISAQQEISSNDYPVKKYGKGSHLVNFHSWLPSVSSSESSITFISENVLNTLQGEASFTYNSNENSKKIGLIGAYGGLFPWLRLGVGYTKDRSASFNGNLVRWDQFELRTGFLLPFNFSGGKTYTSLRFGTDYVFNKPIVSGANKNLLDDKSYGYTNSYLTFTSQVQKARQHIYPRFAQTIKTEFSYGITQIEGRQFLADGLWYFPGVFNNHSLVFNTAWQSRDTARNILFSNNFPFSRGYNVRSFFNMYKLAANYHMPLAYPDWGFASIVYFQRIRANFFFDFTHIQDFDQNRAKVTREYRSYGTEIFFDTKWWNQQPLSFGIRYSRLLDANVQGISANQWEIVLPVTIINR